jgi:hypothetical protein
MATTNLVTDFEVQTDERNIKLKEIADTNCGTHISRLCFRFLSESRTGYEYTKFSIDFQPPSLTL